MLEAQANTPLVSNNLNTKNLTNNIKVNEINLSELKIPFIYFFNTSIKFGLLKDLGSIEKIKNKCSVYSGYIDRWLANAIKEKDITILKDGEISPKQSNLADVYKSEDKKESCELLKNISNKITEVALKDVVTGRPKGLSTCNFYGLKDHPDILIEYKSIMDRFWSDMEVLRSKSARIENLGAKVHYLSVSTCSIDEEVLSEI